MLLMMNESEYYKRGAGIPCKWKLAMHTTSANGLQCWRREKKSIIWIYCCWIARNYFHGKKESPADQECGGYPKGFQSIAVYTALWQQQNKTENTYYTGSYELDIYNYVLHKLKLPTKI